MATNSDSNSPLTVLATLTLADNVGSPELQTSLPSRSMNTSSLVDTTDTEMAAAIDEVVQDVFGEKTDSRAGESDVMSPTAKQRITFSESSLVAESSLSDSADEEPLINLQERIRQRLQKGKTPIYQTEPLVEGPPGSLPDQVAKLFAEVESTIANESGIDGSLQAPSDATASVQENVKDNIAQTLPMRVTRSRTNQQLEARCQPKKRSSPGIPVSPALVDDVDPAPTATDASLKKPKKVLPCSSASNAFRSSLAQGLWPFLCARNLFREHSLVPSRVKKLGIVESLTAMGLGQTVLNVPTYVLRVVLEFYANLCPTTADVSSPYYHKSYITWCAY